MDVKTFGVIGSGQMGNGIAQVAAAAGLNVIMSDIQQEFCEKGMATIAGSLGRLVKKEKISEGDRQAILGRIRSTTDLSDMAGADFVVEAAVELDRRWLEIEGDQVGGASDPLHDPVVVIVHNNLGPEELVKFK